MKAGLVKKQITDRNGKRTTVWVKQSQKPVSSPTHKGDIDELISKMGYGHGTKYSHTENAEQFKRLTPNARHIFVEPIVNKTKFGVQENGYIIHYLYDKNRFGRGQKENIELGESYSNYLKSQDIKPLKGDNKYTKDELKQYKQKSITSAMNSRVMDDDLMAHMTNKQRGAIQPKKDEWGGEWAARILSSDVERKGWVREDGDLKWKNMTQAPKIPKSVYDEVKKWDISTISPFSYSFYDIPDKSWDYTAEGSHRIADHWNFASRGKVHAKTTTDVPDDGHFRLAVYENGKYRILKDLGKVDMGVKKANTERLLGY